MRGGEGVEQEEEEEEGTSGEPIHHSALAVRRGRPAKIAITSTESNEIKLHYLACHAAINHTPFSRFAYTRLRSFWIPVPYTRVYMCTRLPIRVCPGYGFQYPGGRLNGFRFAYESFWLLIRKRKHLARWCDALAARQHVRARLIELKIFSFSSSFAVEGARYARLTDTRSYERRSSTRRHSRRISREFPRRSLSERSLVLSAIDLAA